MHWYFERVDPNRFEASSAAFRNTLAGSSLERAEMLVREAIQNSVDAFEANPGRREPGAKPLVVFRRSRLDGANWERFRDTLFGGEEWVERSKTDAITRAKIGRLLEPATTGIDLLVIEDHQTHGLIHDPKSTGSHMRKLLFELGNEAKVSGQKGSGGSFGYGKSVFQVSGQHRIIIAYSHFDPALDNKGVSARLLGVAYLDGHTANGKEFTGKAVFPASRTDPGDWSPVENDAAHDLAERLGFERRREGDYGTSVMILNPDVLMRDLAPAIETWWWPRLIDDRLDVRISENGVKLDPPRPKNRGDLAKYIKAYNHLRTGDTATATTSFMVAPIKYGGGEAGKLALLANVPGSGELDDGEDDGVFQEIALFRRPGMVVKYHHVRGLNRGAIGVFVADDNYDDAFKRSENPAHNDWDKKAERASPDDKKMIDSVYKAIGKQAREFARRATPAAPVTGVRLAVIEQALDRAFKTPKQPGIVGGKQSTDIHVTSVKESIVADGEEAFAKGSFVVTLDAKFPHEKADGLVEVECHLLVAGTRSPEDRIDIELTGPDGRVLPFDREREGWSTTFRRGVADRWSWKSATFRSDWSVEISVGATVDKPQTAPEAGGEQ